MMTPAVLICTQLSQSNDRLCAYLKGIGYERIRHAMDEMQAKHLIALHRFTIILVDLPFTMNSHELSFLLSMAEGSDALVMALVNERDFDHVRDRMEQLGILTLKKPLQREMFSQLLAIGRAWAYRNHSLHKKQERLIDQIQEIKLVDRAKCLLIENEWISEEEAHKRIEKAAMDERVTRKSIAQRIIAQYEE